MVVLISSSNPTYFEGEAFNFKNGMFYNSFEDAKPVFSSSERHKGNSFWTWILNRKKTKKEWTLDEITQFTQFAKYEKRDFSNNLDIVFINHASFLIQIEGVNIITDPIWSKRASPVSFFGPERFVNPPFGLQDLPKIDYILISHSHFDHLDLPTLKKLNKMFNPIIFAGLGVCKFLASQGLKNCIEKNWGEWIEVKKDFKIYFEMAKHWSKRSLFDANKLLWGSFVIHSPKFKVYFAGDTGYGKHFEMIGKKYQGFDIALLPVGAYEPRYIMAYSHLNPEEAILAHKDLNSKQSFGMHLKTFQLTDEGFNQPVVDLETAKNKHKINADRFTILNFGERRIF